VLKIDRSALGLTVVSAVLQVLIFPLPNLYCLSWIAVAPLIVAILRCRAPETPRAATATRRFKCGLLPGTPWQGFVLGYLCGILWFAGT